MSLYKTARCRFFDDLGRPVKPYCSKRADVCRFLHPSDPDWAKRARKPNTYDSRSDHKSSRPSYPSSSRHFTPLGGQSDHFHRHLEAQNDRKSKSHRETSERASGKPPESRAPTESQKPGSSKEAYNSGSGAHSEVKESANKDNSVKVPLQSTELLSPELKMAQTIVDLFRRVAKISNNVIQDTTACSSDEKQLRSYTELSSTLSEVSPNAASAMTSTLADIVLRHAKRKEHLEHDFHALEIVWEDVFDVFLKGVTRSIDSKLEEAVSSLKKAGERVSASIAAASSGTDHAAQRSAPLGPHGYGKDAERSRYPQNSSVSRHEAEGGPSSKRRPYDDTEFDVKRTKRLKLEDSEKELGPDGTLDDLRSQLAKQAQRLESLMEENNQLRSAMVQHGVSGPISTSVSSHSFGHIPAGSNDPAMQYAPFSSNLAAIPAAFGGLWNHLN